jgi:hypothetical protein
MTKAQSKAGHKRPEFLERKEKGVYAVKGTALTIHQDGKGWKVTGHAELAAETFANRHAATERIEALGLVPAEPAKQPEAQQQPKGDDKAEKPKEQPRRRPPVRKAKESAKASA